MTRRFDGRRFLPFGLVLFGCGAASSTKAPAPTPHVDAWSRLAFEDRHSAMTFTVLPNMAQTWRELKKTEYAEMTCRTCHGKDAESVSYRMPNASLPAIDPTHPPPGAMSDFMKTRVVPEMLDLLKTTPEHFGCRSCHPGAKR